MGAIYLGSTRVSPFVHTTSTNASNFVSFIVYCSTNSSITSGTINNVSYTSKTFTIEGHDVLVAIVPKNTSFSYSINGSTWINGTGTLSLSNDYILELTR